MNARFTHLRGALGAATLTLPALAGDPPRYTVMDLGLPLGANPTSISDRSHVAGNYFAEDDERRAFIWYRGAMADIGTLGGTAQAASVNDSGVVVGYSVDGQDRQRGIRAENGLISDIGTLRGGVHAAANAINNAGWIAGMSFVKDGNDQLQRAALWRNGVVIDLGTFGGEYSEAMAINDVGQVVGWAWYPPPRRDLRAFLWTEGTGMIDLGTLGGGSSIATDVNDRGAVVGSAFTADGVSHAFLWTAQEGMVDLGLPPDAIESHASAINNAGVAVGFSYIVTDDFRIEPLLWQDGVLHLVNDLIDPASGWTIVQAGDINDRGVIAATARPGDAPYRTVLLVPSRPTAQRAQRVP